MLQICCVLLGAPQGALGWYHEVQIRIKHILLRHALSPDRRLGKKCPTKGTGGLKSISQSLKRWINSALFLRFLKGYFFLIFDYL